MYIGLIILVFDYLNVRTEILTDGMAACTFMLAIYDIHNIQYAYTSHVYDIDIWYIYKRFLFFL